MKKKPLPTMAATPQIPDKEAITLERARSLKNWNGYASLAHFIVFMAFFIAFAIALDDEGENALKGIRTSSYVTVPVFQRATQASTSQSGASTNPGYGTEEGRNVSERGIQAIERVPNNNLVLPFLILGFSLITAAFHFVNYLELRQKIRELQTGTGDDDGTVVDGEEEKKEVDRDVNRDPPTADADFGTYGNSVLKNACNHRRWMEYAITATVMVIIVALSFGLREFYALLFIACIVPTVMYMGHLVEKAMNRWAQTTSSENSRTEAARDAWIATGFGWALLFVIFGVLLTSLQDTLTTLDEFRETLKKLGDEETLSDFNDFKGLIIASCCVIIVFYVTFGVVQVVDLVRATPFSFFSWQQKNTGDNDGGNSGLSPLRYLQDQEKRGYTNEKYYCVLSFVSKISLIVLLGWGLFGRSRGNSSSTSSETENSATGEEGNDCD
jgi:hypothetical protein